jgi:DNA-binding response OmpR family regulator
MRLGAKAVLRKPFEMLELRAALASVAPSHVP